MPAFKKWQVGGSTLDPLTTTVNFAGMTSSVSGDVTTITNTGDISGVTAGAGLTGGGSSGAVSLAVGAGTGITVNADDVALTANFISGTQVGNTADGNVISGIDTVHMVEVPDGATGDVDVTVTHKVRVLDVWLVKTAGAGGMSDTITVKNGATAITNALDINVADKTVVRAGTIDDAQWEIAAAGTLRVTRTKASMANVACKVFVRVLRVA